MLSPAGNSFHPARGIGQGDTPSTLVFIAVFDILLSLLDSSSTGIAHAYADDLIHLAPDLDLQQRHADLVCGFCAFTGLEISLSKVEAISINYGGIMYNTPFLILHDWHWHMHRVQHQDDGYWVSYLGLFLDKRSCSKHFHRAKLKLQMLCRLLTRKVAPPAAKKLVYSLCLKSQIRYPAGLAPWTPHQYEDLDRAPTELFRHIYGLRRTYPTDLIYSPIQLGGCGESRLSDTAQLQKWQYLHSTSHLGSCSADVVTELLQRAQLASATDPSYFCTSLIDWGRRMGLTLGQAPTTALPQAILSFPLLPRLPRLSHAQSSLMTLLPLMHHLFLTLFLSPPPPLLEDTPLLRRGYTCHSRGSLPRLPFLCALHTSLPRMPTTRSFLAHRSPFCCPRPLP